MILSTKNLIRSAFAALVKNIAVIVSTCTIILAPSAVLSQDNASPDNNDPVAVYKEAGITAEQESTIRKLAQEYDQESAVRLQSLAQMLTELKDMTYKPVLDENAMLAKQGEINKLQSEMAIQRIKLVIKIRSLLSPAQNEKLVAALQNRVRSEEQVKLR